MSLAIPREAAARFRAAARKCLSRRKGPDPPVRVEVRNDVLTLFAWLDEVGLALSVPLSAPPMSAAVRLSSLDSPGLGGQIEPDREGEEDFRPAVPVLPNTLAAMPSDFLTALHEAGRTAARDPGKYAVTHVQVQGSKGKVTATDGRQALSWRGFTFPFSDDLLVPAVPVFGLKDVATQLDVQAGKSGDHLVVTAGPWAVWLPVDAHGKFPDVEAAVPRSRMSTTLELLDSTAWGLLDSLTEWPGAKEDHAAVTLHLGPSVRACALLDESAQPTCVTLYGGTTTGPAVSVVVNRRTLERALRLGFRRFRFVPDRPWVAADDNRTYLAVTLDPSTAVGPRPDSTAVSQCPELKKESPMPPNPSTNGHAPADRNADSPDPLELAETLKADLADAHAVAGQLVAALKAQRRQRRTVESALASLRSLRLE